MHFFAHKEYNYITAIELNMHYYTSYAAATEDFSVYPDVLSPYEMKTRKQECQRKMGTSDETK